MNANSTSPSYEDQPWGACPEGAIASLNRQVASGERRRRIVRIAGAATIGVAMIAAAMLTPRLDSADSREGLYCRECRSHFTEYAAYLHRETSRDYVPLSDVILDEMHVHLKKCKSCRDKFEAAYPDALHARAAAADFRIAVWQPNFSAEYRQQAW